MKFENFVIVSFQITVSSNHYDIYQPYVFQLLVIYIATMYIYLLHMVSQLLLDYGQISTKKCISK